MIRVVLIDDHELTRIGFRLVLEATGRVEVVGEAADGDEGVQLAHRLRPDVTLMDLRMPKVDGIEATRRLVGADGPPPTRVLVMTTFGEDEYVFGALRAGASGFLLKDAPRRRLLEAIELVAAGEAMLDPAVTLRVVRAATEGRARGEPAHEADDPRLAELTARERDVLVRIAHGRTNAEIAAEFNLATATVKTHLYRIFWKLGLRDRTQAAILAYETGLVRPERST